jgi:hypothetical protein
VGDGVLREGVEGHGLEVFFFSNEGEEPPHVHVERGGGVVKVWLSKVAVAQCRGVGS